MQSRLTQQDMVETDSAYTLLLDRTAELEMLNAGLKRSFEAASRDSSELRDSNAAKDEVLGLLAHELRAPLTVILGNAGILLSKRAKLEPEAVDAALHDIQTDATRLQRLIANLLALARPGLEDALPDEPLDFCRLVQTTIEEHRRLWPQREVILSSQEARFLVAGQPGYTEEVMVNLLSNAEKYSPTEQPIEVRLHRAGDQIQTSVLDRGPGISPDEALAVFHPFYRSPATSRKAKGLGLGLAVCKRLVEAQGGSIWVAARQGGGSEFAFRLPLAHTCDRT